MDQFKVSRQRKRQFTRGNFTEQELVALLDEAVHYGVNYAVESLQATMAIVLKDKIGISRPKIRKAMEETSKYYKSITEGYVTIEDVKQAVEEEIGITFSKN